MNTKYIKKCEMATELQKEWCPACGDYMAFRNVRHETDGTWKLIRDTLPFTLGAYKIHVFLPSSDQLEKILLKWYKKNNTSPTKPFTTMFDDLGYLFWHENPAESIKTLLLLLLMKNKYGKKWDGKKQEFVK